MRIVEWLIEHVILPGLAVAIALTVRLTLGPLQPGEGAAWLAAAGLAGWVFDHAANVCAVVRAWRLRERRIDAGPSPVPDM